MRSAWHGTLRRASAGEWLDQHLCLSRGDGAIKHECKLLLNEAAHGDAIADTVNAIWRHKATLEDKGPMGAAMAPAAVGATKISLRKPRRPVHHTKPVASADSCTSITARLQNQMRCAQDAACRGEQQPAAPGRGTAPNADGEGATWKAPACRSRGHTSATPHVWLPAAVTPTAGEEPHGATWSHGGAMVEPWWSQGTASAATSSSAKGGDPPGILNCANHRLRVLSLKMTDRLKAQNSDV